MVAHTLGVRRERGNLGHRPRRARIASEATSRDVFYISRQLGWCGTLRTPLGLSRLTFGHKNRSEVVRAFLDNGRALAQLPCEDDWAESAAPDDEVRSWCALYAAGQSDRLPTLSLDLRLRTAFQQRVMAACQQIPWGNTRSYLDLAQQVGCLHGARAVGRVMATNPVPLIVPCHRVVSANGHLGGFSAPQGLDMKKYLLGFESSSLRTSV